ncbi:MAG: hypothetical protein R3E21_04660 [Caenibius sp.]
MTHTLPDNARSDDVRARNRFAVLSALRLGGVVLVGLGLLAINQALPIPPIVGWVLLPAGIVEIFIVPQILARIWRTPVP